MPRLLPAVLFFFGFLLTFTMVVTGHGESVGTSLGLTAMLAGFLLKGGSN